MRLIWAWALSPGKSAGVTQLAECLLPKQDVEGSSPFTRSTVSRETGGRRLQFPALSRRMIPASFSSAATRSHAFRIANRDEAPVSIAPLPGMAAAWDTYHRWDLRTGHRLLGVLEERAAELIARLVALLLLGVVVDPHRGDLARP